MAACVMVNVSVNGVPEFGMTFGVWLLTWMLRGA